jgi:hypothetical protein
VADLSIPKISFEISDDAMHGTIRVGGETIVADVHNVEALIANLGLMRAQMSPPVALAAPADRRTLVVDSPALEVSETDDNRYLVFAFRTPAYGWIRFNVPLAQAAALGRHLAEHVVPRFPVSAEKE